MDDIGTVERQTRAHPGSTGGATNEEYWLNAMQGALASAGNYEAAVEFYVEELEQKPESLEWYIAESAQAALFWDVLDTLYTVSAYGTDLALVQGRVFVHPNLRS